MCKRKLRMPRVKSCPCCGSKARVGARSWNSWGVICNECGLRTETHGDDDRACIQQAVKSWNLRKPVEELQDEIDDLRAEVEDLQRQQDEEWGDV